MGYEHEWLRKEDTEGLIVRTLRMLNHGTQDQPISSPTQSTDHELVHRVDTEFRLQRFNVALM